MSSPVPTLLLTRPKAASLRFAHILRQKLGENLSICVSPLMEIQPTAKVLQYKDAKGLVFSSTHGIEVASKLTNERVLPVYCIGAASTRAAKHVGWKAFEAGSDASSLIKWLLNNPINGPLLHLRGTHSRGEISAKLTAGGLPTNEKVIYDQVMADFNREARLLLLQRSPVIVPLFSPRSAAHFSKQALGNAALFYTAFSQSVADEIQGDCIVANRPNIQAMAEVVEIAFKQASRVERR